MPYRIVLIPISKIGVKAVIVTVYGIEGKVYYCSTHAPKPMLVLLLTNPCAYAYVRTTPANSIAQLADTIHYPAYIGGVVVCHGLRIPFVLAITALRRLSAKAFTPGKYVSRRCFTVLFQSPGLMVITGSSGSALRER